MTNTPDSFFGLGIAPGILEILAKLKFVTPTPIQFKAIPIGIEGKDIIGIAQTGTGKTMAFGIPMIQRLAQKKGRGLVLVPTRELALQVSDALKKLTPAFQMKIAVVIGGESMFLQVQALRGNPSIIVATPGRLNDHIQQRNVRLDDVNTLVLDEADRMLDMGFLPQIERIFKMIPKEKRQTLLFSATMPGSIMKIASAYMHLPVSIEMAPAGTAATLVSQELFIVRKALKMKLLEELLKKYSGSVLLFMRTKHEAKKVTRGLRAANHSAAEIHANRSLGQRKEALAGFKSGRYRILVATDIASRGIDVTGIELVINYDLPDDPENYVHRIGRTGRAGKEGHAITFATPEQGGDVRTIEKIMRTPIPKSEHPDLPVERFAQHNTMGAHVPRPFQPQRRHGGFQRRGGPQRHGQRGFGQRHGR